MKKVCCISLITTLLFTVSHAQNVAINATGAAPQASAMLDISNPNKGLLIPRVALTGINDVSTIPSPATSLLVYSTTNNGNITPGFYYWQSGTWTKIMGSSGVNYQDFYALMPPDNNSPIAIGSPVAFPHSTISNSNIQPYNNNSFFLPEQGAYEISYVVSVQEPGQLIAVLNGVELPQTVSGRASGTSQICGTFIISTPFAFSTLSINNPVSGNYALIIAPNAGGIQAVSAHLLIRKLN